MAPIVAEEEYFPRVGPKELQKNKENIEDKKKNTFINIFSDKKENKNIAKKKKKNEGEKKKVKEKPVLAIKAVPTLKFGQLKEGMVMGAVISEVTDYSVKVSLPCHMTANLSIVNISSTFTEILRKCADDTKTEDDEIKDVPSLDQLFQVGQFVVVAVCSVKQGDRKIEIEVSLDPKLVMAGRSPGVGDLCVASVVSKEDHGYIMDVGANNVKGFLPIKAASKHFNKNLCVGGVVLCVVTKKDKGALTLKCDPEKVYSNLNTEVNLHNVIPATNFNAKVEDVLENGLKLKIGKDVDAYLHKDLLPPDRRILKEYTTESELVVSLVHVIPTVNTVLVSARPIWPFNNNFGQLKSGELLDNVKIVEVQKNHLILQLPNSLPGFVSARHAQANFNSTKPLKESFKKGSKLRVRIIGLDYFSGQAVCSLHKEQVSGATKLEHLKVGEKVKAEVKQFKSGGLEVVVNTLRGFIPTLYLSDVPLKHPEKKFLPGDKINCKVIKVNPEKNRLHLTSKPYLVKHDFDFVSTWEEAKVGVVTEGVVAKITTSGLLINLLGEMRGWAPSSELSTETIEAPEKVFWVGQSVKCQLKTVKPEKQSITLSLIINNKAPKLPKERKEAARLTMGNFYTAKVLKVTSSGLEVDVETEAGHSVASRIPCHHLTDNLGLAQDMLHSYKEGDTVEALYFVHDTVPILTMKPIIIQAVKSGTIPTNRESVTEGSVLPAVVKTASKAGIVMSVPIWPSVRAFVPIRHVSSFFIEDITQVVEEGQTLMMKVLEKTEEGKNLVGTTNIEVLKSEDECSASDLVQYLLQDLHFLRSRSTGVLATLKTGDLVTVVVKEMTEMGAIMETEKGGVTALAPASNLGTSRPEPGDKLKAVVLFVAHKNGVIEVSCDQSLVSSIQQKKKSQEIPKVNEVVKGDVVLTRTHLNLRIVAVKQPSKFAGKLVFVPDSVYLNELLSDDDSLDNDKEMELLVKNITTDNQIIALDNNKVKKQGVGKKKRSNSQSENSGNKRKRTESDSISSNNKNKKKADVQAPQSILKLFAKNSKDESGKQVEKMEVETKPVDQVAQDTDEGKSKKKKKKNKKQNEEQEQDATSMEVDDVKKVESPVKPANNEKENAGGMMSDPGWDFSLTGVTLPAWGKVSIWGDEEESEAEEEGGEGEGGKKHVSKKEAKRLKKEEEKAAEMEENRIILGENLPPQTEQEFEKLVASSPDSSLVWIQFMAFYLQSCQYDQARAVARRAVDRINFREENERLNVYLAWLNLENAFGSPESLDKVLKDAVQRNDEYKVYSQMAEIFSKSSKINEAEKIFKILAKKFGKVKDVWIRYGLFCFKHSRMDEGRFVFTRALQNLETREAADLSAKFAQIEFKYGDPERGKTMYEKLVASYPKRIDIWSSYADQLTRIGDVTATRALYTRISTLGLQAKKMKPLFAKWLDFETSYGTEQQQGEVRAAALKYLNSRSAGAEEPAEA